VPPVASIIWAALSLIILHHTFSGLRVTFIEHALVVRQNLETVRTQGTGGFNAGGQGLPPRLSWHEHRRFSNRQKQITPLSGAIGTWQLTNLSPSFSQMLYIGQWLHLGKETVFGNGQYRIIQAA